MDVEKKLVNDLRYHEQILQIIPYDELIQERDSIKSVAKTLAGMASPAKDLNTAKKVLGDFGFNAKQIAIKVYGNKKYIIFKGHPGARNIFRGTRYLASNPKILRFAIGPRGILKSVKSGFALTVVLSVGVEVFYYFLNDSTALSQLLGNVSSDLLKIGISSITAAVAGLTFGSMTAVTTLVAGPFIVAIAAGLFAGYVLNRIDRKYGATAALIKKYKEMGIILNEISYKTRRTYNYLENHPSSIMRLFGGPVTYGGFGY